MSLTTRTLLLVLLALVPALAIQGYNEYALRGTRDEAVRADALATARVVALNVRQLAGSIEQALDLVAEDPTVRARDPQACTAYLKRAVARIPHLLLLALARPDGPVICNNLGSAPGSYSNAERDYHRRALAEGGFVVGTYARGIATGKDSVHFARPLLAEDGTVLGVLTAAIDLSWLADYLQPALRMDSTATTLTGRDGLILVRRPDDAGWVGRPIASDSLVKLDAQAEGVRIDIAYDGRERVIAQVLPDGVLQGMRVIVGRDRDLAFADVDQATRRGLILIALGAALAVAAALVAGRAFIRRPFKRLDRAAAAWNAGDLDVRTDLRGSTEFGRLGARLDAMAAALQRHETSLREEIERGREMQARQVTMLHELNHRVKNTLATVQSLIRQSSREGAGRAEELEARILALSKTHDLLTRDDWNGAPLREVLENEIGAYRTAGERFVVSGPDVELPARHVLALGMALHELTTNAAKYGALSTPAGQVRIGWKVVLGESGMRHLCLDWVEAGGPPAVVPKRRGFGTRLIAMCVERELGGVVHLDFTPEGLHCTVDVPMDDTTGVMLSPHLVRNRAVSDPRAADRPGAGDVGGEG